MRGTIFKTLFHEFKHQAQELEMIKHILIYNFSSLRDTVMCIVTFLKFVSICCS